MIADFKGILRTNLLGRITIHDEVNTAQCSTADFGIPGPQVNKKVNGNTGSSKWLNYCGRDLQGFICSCCCWTVFIAAALVHQGSLPTFGYEGNAERVRSGPLCPWIARLQTLGLLLCSAWKKQKRWVKTGDGSTPMLNWQWITTQVLFLNINMFANPQFFNTTMFLNQVEMYKLYQH